jgi:bifunctional non-homologous end joining protein LigD
MARSRASGRPRRRTKRVPARLREYQRKRDFTVTTEPAPSAPPRASGAPSFMVHKHDATRLHYDLRLEIDGALASWSVPKGPSYDPAAKRLAIQVEDHPLEYGAFEGRIPDGEYGAGDSLIWDRGVYQTVPPGQAGEQRKRGRLHLVLLGEKLRGGWHLVRGGRPQGGQESWLLFKARDESADPGYDVITQRPESVVSGRVATRGPERAGVLRAAHPAPESLLERVFPPMLATLAGSPAGLSDGYRYSLKIDGYRALAALSGGKVALWSRNALDLTGRFGHLAHALARLVVGEAVLDGEIAVLDASGAPRFQLLQRGRDREAVFWAFDLLWLDGQDLRSRPFEERRDLLVSLFANTPASLRVIEEVPGPAEAALQAAKARGFEGVVAKERGSRYEPRRSRAWLKLKAQQGQELAVVGFTPSTKGTGEVGALHLAVADGKELRWAGKVGTGFTAQQRKTLWRELSRDVIEAPACAGAPRARNARWVQPRLVAQVEFTEWTADGKLRHPSFQGLREDKSPMDAVREGTPSAASESRVKLTHADKVLFPREGITKADLAAYFEAVREPLLRALAGRPLSLKQFPKGVHDPKPWFRQDLGARPPAYLHVVETPSRARGRPVRHLVANSADALRWLAQNNVLEVHAWHSREGSLTSPDWVVFDLDPAEGQGLPQAIEVALALRGMFERLGLPSVPKTSGKRGLHLFVPLAPGHTYQDALAFALQVGGAVETLLPQTTLERSLRERRGRLYLDCMQNAYGKTLIAPYSPRPVDGASVSAPLQWSEVQPGLDASAFTLRTMPERLAKVGDLFAEALAAGVRLPQVGD